MPYFFQTNFYEHIFFLPEKLTHSQQFLSLSKYRFYLFKIKIKTHFDSKFDNL